MRQRICDKCKEVIDVEDKYYRGEIYLVYGDGSIVPSQTGYLDLCVKCRDKLEGWLSKKEDKWYDEKIL